MVSAIHLIIYMAILKRPSVVKKCPWAIDKDSSKLYRFHLWTGLSSSGDDQSKITYTQLLAGYLLLKKHTTFKEVLRAGRVVEWSWSIFIAFLIAMIRLTICWFMDNTVLPKYFISSSSSQKSSAILFLRSIIIFLKHNKIPIQTLS